MQKFKERWAAWVLSHRILVLVLSLLLAVACGFGAQYLTIANDYRTYFEHDNPQLLEYENLEKNFASVDNIFIAVGARNGDLFNPESLAMLHELTQAAWKVPYSIRVDSLTNFQYSRVDGDEIEAEALFEDAASLQPAEIRRRQQIALDEPFLKSALVAPDGRATGINITMSLPTDRDFGLTQEAVEHVRTLIAGYAQRYPEHEFHLIGDLVLDIAFAETSASDTMTLFPLMALVVFGLLMIILRNVPSVLITMLVIIAALAMAVGLIGWGAARLTPDGVSALAMILPLAIADCIHLLATFFAGRRQQMPALQAMHESLVNNLGPIILTSVTTAVGFLSLATSDSPPIRLMGYSAAIGVLAACLLSITLLPALMTLIPIKPPALRAKKFELVPAWMPDLVIAHHRKLFLPAMGVLVLSIALALSLNKVDETILDYFDDSTQFRQDTDWVEQHLTGVIRLEYSISAQDENAVTDLAYLDGLDRFAQWLRQQPEVVSVTAFSDIMKRLNRNMNADDPAYHRMPESRELASQYHLLYEMSLPFGFDLNNQVNFDKSATRLSVALKKMSDRDVLAFERAAHTWQQQHLPVHMISHATGPAMMFGHQLERNVFSIVGGLFVSLTLISVLMMLFLRDWRLGVISLIPNLVPAIVAFAVWGIIDGEIGLALSIVMGMTFGIVVDDTIHFLSKYQHSRQKMGQSVEQGIRYALEKSGDAMVITTLVLSVAFTILATSSFEPNQNMGILTSMILQIALTLDLVFLPVLLLIFDRRNRNQKSSDPLSAESAEFVKADAAQAPLAN